jgi:hypothetical protein
MGTREQISSETRRLADRLSETTQPELLRTVSLQLIPLLTDYWDLHPHSAMEMLEFVTVRLPLPLAHATVRQVVTAWKKKPTYYPEAGGSADHCYLSALILSENFDLADQPWATRVLPSTLAKELNYPRFDRIRDGAAREALVRALADSQPPS